jgi:hypothetical protein
MSIDFTDVHTFRIPNLSYDFEIEAFTIEDLGRLAYQEAQAFFGDQRFAIDSMNVRKQEASGTYTADVCAEAR